MRRYDHGQIVGSEAAIPYLQGRVGALKEVERRLLGIREGGN